MEAFVLQGRWRFMKRFRPTAFLAAEKEALLAFFVSRMLVWVLAWLAFRWIVHGTAFPVASETEM